MVLMDGSDGLGVIALLLRGADIDSRIDAIPSSSAAGTEEELKEKADFRGNRGTSPTGLFMTSILQKFENVSQERNNTPAEVLRRQQFNARVLRFIRDCAKRHFTNVINL